MRGFSPAQTRALSAKLDNAHVQTREDDGRAVSYIEGWFAIAEANAIFGFGGWDREMVHFERLFERSKVGGIACAYLARVRITVRTSDSRVVREGTGFGYALRPQASDAHERALKSAETDATKRALATFGNRFGLSLYDKSQASAPAGKCAASRVDLIAADGTVVGPPLSAETFATGLRQLIEVSTSAEELGRLKLANSKGLSSLHKQFPELRNSKGRHYALILEDLFETRSRALQPTVQAVASDREVRAGGRQFSTAEASATGNFNSLGAESKSIQDVTDAGALVEPTAPSSEVARPVDSTLVLPKPSKISFAPAIDKSALLISQTRRIRNKAHLDRVGSKPCLVCEEAPCHAHHLTFAQPRGLSVKVSDEFTVPLCAFHHNELHSRLHNERSFWHRHGLDPLAAALSLWQETLATLTSDAAS
jgi:DNA recombination protein Rad52